jgi:hypothetical protein
MYKYYSEIYVLFHLPKEATDFIYTYIRCKKHVKSSFGILNFISFDRNEMKLIMSFHLANPQKCQGAKKN